MVMMVKVSEQKLSSTSGTFEFTNDKAIYWTVNMVLEVAVIIKNETNNTSLALAVITILVYGIPCFWGHKKRRKGWGGLLGGGGGGGWGGHMREVGEKIMKIGKDHLCKTELN